MTHLGQIVFSGNNVACVFGVTDGTADTALATLPPNPFKDDRVLAIALGEGCYVEDDGSVQPYQSGVTATTIDVRSSATSKYFCCLVFALAGGTTLTRDHSAVTT